MPALLERAEGMFPEGGGKPKAVAKAGAAARLTNGLVVNAKDAIDELWKARGYMKIKPVQRKEKLGYQLDREEALGYVVTSALHKPLLSPLEARTIGKRAGALPVFSKLAGYRKRGTVGSRECMLLLTASAPLSFAPPKAKPPAPAAAQTQPPPSPEKPPPAPPPPPPPPPPLPPPSTPLAAESMDERIEYLHPYGCWDENRKYVWSDDSIPGYRGLPGGDPEERFWNPEKPPCVPSDHRPLHLFNSWEAAEAAGKAARVEKFSPRLDDDGEYYYDAGDEEMHEIAYVEHKWALRRLREAFLEVSGEHHTRPCPCGRGALAMWPWVVQTKQLGFCDCWMAGWELNCWRHEWIRAGYPDLAW